MKERKLSRYSMKSNEKSILRWSTVMAGVVITTVVAGDAVSMTRVLIFAGSVV